MLPIVTISQMRAIDTASIDGDGARGFAYMRAAAKGLYEVARQLLARSPDGIIGVVCGSGNNGGDGFVAAALLLEQGYSVRCYTIAEPLQLRGEARQGYDEYFAHNNPLLVIRCAQEIPDFSPCTLLIDALLGTGSRGEPRPLVAALIDAMNQSALPILAVDTPSGMDNDRGSVAPSCIRAHTTVAMGFAKIGSFFSPAKSFVGRLIVQELDYPHTIVESFHPTLFAPDHEHFCTILPPRHPEGSKHAHGLVCMVCGSPGMSGSAALAAQAALRSGCGMVHAAIPRSIFDVLSIKLNEVVLHPLSQTTQGSVACAAAAEVLALSATMQALCIGPGLSHHPDTTAAVRGIVSQATVPIVLDADGLNAYKERAEELKLHRSPLIITPHAGEWERLFGPLPPEPQAACERLQTIATEYRMTIVYKGAPTLIASGQGRVYLLASGNSGMATAGSGDVLSGIITALIAQGSSVQDAAVLGVYLHGKAGDYAARARSEYSLIASDIIEHLGAAFMSLLGGQDAGDGLSLGV
jgi:NAD(P)H-hydrate epimerase